MNIRKLTLLAPAAGAVATGVLVLAPLPAHADAYPNWGQEVKACNQSDCYPGGTNRGAYVSGQARDDQGPGYAWEIHTYAQPGNSGH